MTWDRAVEPDGVCVIDGDSENGGLHKLRVSSPFTY